MFLGQVTSGPKQDSHFKQLQKLELPDLIQHRITLRLIIARPRRDRVMISVHLVPEGLEGPGWGGRWNLIGRLEPKSKASVPLFREIFPRHLRHVSVHYIPRKQSGELYVLRDS